MNETSSFQFYGGQIRDRTLVGNSQGILIKDNHLHLFELAACSSGVGITPVRERDLFVRP